ncbi:MAG: leucine-rich repeat protein [Coriobacteriia bacterium]|nr:leucine-rich repeat protein [Coriobacteriia bacterium]
MTPTYPTALRRAGAAALLAFALAALLALVPGLARADVGQTFTQDGMAFTITGQDTVKVGAGASGDAVAMDAVDVTIPATVEHQGTAYDVTAVGGYAFSGHTALRSVTLPASVTRLEEYAFAYCGTLDDSADPISVSGLVDFVLPANTKLSYIGKSCFYQDYALKDFVIPATVSVVSSCAFYDCLSFKHLQFEEGSTVQEIGTSTFELSWKKRQVRPREWTDTESFVWLDEEWVDWDWETGIKNSPDYGGLESAELPASLKVLSDRCFFNQRNLKELSFKGDAVDAFHKYCFGFCTSLKEVVLPDAGCKDPGTYTWRLGFGSYTFVECINLEKVTFGRNKSGQGRWNTIRMFDGCKKLKTVVYRYNRIIPTSFWTSSGFDGTSVDGKSLYAFNSSEPTLYHTVYFCADKDDLGRDKASLGTAVIREGIKAYQVRSALSPQDEEGAVILEGAVPALPAGYDTWALTTCKKRTDLQANTKIEEPCYAYPAKTSDLTRGSAVLSSDAYWFSNEAHKPDVKVVSALGQTLSEGTDYTLAWERMVPQEPSKEDSGEKEKEWDPNDPTDPRNDDDPDNDDPVEPDTTVWEPASDFTNAGTLRVTATAVEGSGYEGSTRATYTIAYLKPGATLTSDGVTYMVTKGQTATSPAEVQVGDGEKPAVDENTEGTVTIPSRILLEGSANPVVVTGIGAMAFGSSVPSNANQGITEVVLPSTLTSIGSFAFGYMPSLRTVTLPASLQSVGNDAFYSCTLLGSVTFKGSKIKTIGSQAFGFCTSLKSLSLPTISENLLGLAFRDCTMLREVTFRGTVAGSPKRGQFSGCTRLETVQYLGGWWDYSYGSYPTITSLAGSGSGKALYTVTSATRKTVTYATCKYTGKAASVPAIVKLGDVTYQVTKIGSKAFAGSKATSVKVARTPSSGLSSAFTGSKVTTITCPGGSKSTAGTYVITSRSKKTVTYAKCTYSGKAASVPATVKLGGTTYKVTKVGSKAFYGAKATSVTVSSKTVTSFSKAFYGSKVKTVKVPASKKKAYAKLLTKARCGKAVKVK